MKIGLVGFAGSGKTSVFNTMTGLDVPTAFGGELRLGARRRPGAGRAHRRPLQDVLAEEDHLRRGHLLRRAR